MHLWPEPENPHDRNAVSVRSPAGIRLGYLQRELASYFQTILLGLQRNGEVGVCPATVHRGTGQREAIRLSLDLAWPAGILRLSPLAAWVARRKEHHSSAARFDAEHFHGRCDIWSGEALGLSGRAVELLAGTNPPLLPRRAWGGELGWLSPRLLGVWRRILERGGIKAESPALGYLLACTGDPTAWLRHPYAPEKWTLIDRTSFASYVGDVEGAFELAVRWHNEDTDHITGQVRRRLAEMPLRVAAKRGANASTVYVAVSVKERDPSVLRLRTVWRGQEALVRLISLHFPDCIPEYSPSWLDRQRLDAFVPSIRVAFEYQGEQHQRPVEYFGGRSGYEKTRERDIRKAKACCKHGVALITWDHTAPVTEERLRSRLEKVGVKISS